MKRESCPPITAYSAFICLQRRCANTAIIASPRPPGNSMYHTPVQAETAIPLMIATIGPTGHGQSTAANTTAVDPRFGLRKVTGTAREPSLWR